MLRRAIGSEQLFRPQCKLVEPHPDILCEYDVEVPIGSGKALTCNVFRLKARTADGISDPVVMCSHPYDNHLTPALKKTPLVGLPQQYRLIPQAGGVPEFFMLTSRELPDPNFWVPASFSLVKLNLTEPRQLGRQSRADVPPAGRRLPCRDQVARRTGVVRR